MIAPPSAPVWVPHPARNVERAARLASEMEAPSAFGHVLVNRGIESLKEARAFLDPQLDALHAPLTLRDLDRAVDRIRAAIEAGERIMIHGDYDVDGITATYLIYSVLRNLGGKVEYRIPHRTRDGYGLSIGAIEDADRRGCSLVVTVDCGITASDAVARAILLGIDIVITDHHEPPTELPPATAVVNPNRTDCPYPFKSLAGVGVAFKLASALLDSYGEQGRANEYLDVVAIGTIADVVPLVGENRVLARHGLDRLNTSAGSGLRALIEVAGLTGRRITSGQVAFVLAPRINAAGRMGNAEQGLGLLLARDDSEGRAFAESLEEDNEQRRAFDEQALDQATRLVERELDWPRCASILLWSDDWHPGVIGIVASRLVERYQRPTILVALEGDRGRGSGRSLHGLDLNQVLGLCADLLEAYGGHALAAGLTVQRRRLPELRLRLERLIAERLAPEDCVPRLKLDDELRLGANDSDLVGWLERLAPHGLGNPEPVFVSRHLAVESTAAVGGGKHLRLRVRDESSSAEAIGFGLGERARMVAEAGRVDLAYVPIRDDWMGVPRIQLRVKDVRPS